MESSSIIRCGFLFVSKMGFQLVFLIEVEVDIAFIAVLPKLFHEPGLAYLAGTANDQRFPLGVILPFDKL